MNKTPGYPMNKSILFSRFRLPFASFVCFVVTSFSPVVLLAATPADLNVVRDLRGPAITAPRLAEVRLDPAILAATRPGFPDLRLFDTAGTEIPRAIEPLYTTRTQTNREAIAASATELRELPQNRLEARFVIPRDKPCPDALDIRTPLKDFIRTVSVSGSRDGITWQPLVQNAVVFDYTRFMDIRRTEIPLPSNGLHYFSVEIGNASEERAQPLIRLVQRDGRDASRAYDLLQTPFRIDGIEFWRETTTQVKDQPVLQEWPHAGFKVQQDAKAKTSTIRLATALAPISRIQLETPARNFQRRASVMVPAVTDGRRSWRTIGQGAFTRVDLPGYTRDDVALDFPETRAEELRLVIHNDDNPPLELTDLHTFGPAYRLLWLADPGAAYRLAYGSEQLAPPAYDLFAIRTALEKGLEPDAWELADGGQAAPVAKPFRLGAFLARPAVFGTILFLAALALLGLLAKALKKAA